MGKGFGFRISSGGWSLFCESPTLYVAIPYLACALLIISNGVYRSYTLLYCVKHSRSSDSRYRPYFRALVNSWRL